MSPHELLDGAGRVTIIISCSVKRDSFDVLWTRKAKGTWTSGHGPTDISARTGDRNRAAGEARRHPRRRGEERQ